MHCIILIFIRLRNESQTFLFIFRSNFLKFFFFVSLKIDHTLCMVLSRHGNLKSNSLGSEAYIYGLCSKINK